MALGIHECREHVHQFLASNDFDLDKALSKGFISVNLILTRACNASCEYCYQSKDFKSCGDTMSQETANKAISFVYSSHPNIQDVTIALFGGEPYTRFELVKHLVEKYPQIKFSITTNGYLLIDNKDYRDWTVKQTNLFVSLSVNALKFRHGENFIEQAKILAPVIASNKAEVHYVVDNPYEPLVFDNVKQLIQLGVNVLRVNFPKESDRLINDKEAFLTLFKRIADMVYIEGIRPVKFGWDAYSDSNIARQVLGQPLKARSSSYCGAGWSYIAVDCNGDVYPCDYFIQFPDKKIGNVFEGYTTKDKVFKGVQDWHKKIYGGCDNCQFGDVRYCTNAMCYAENMKVEGDMFKPTKHTCALRALEYEVYKYIATITKDKGIVTPNEKHIAC